MLLNSVTRFVGALPAKGLAGYYYLSINDPSVSDTMALPAGVTVDAVNGQAVLGVWA